MLCLKSCLVSVSLLPVNAMFLYDNIDKATTFDPFTHVYMFSCGFNPSLWLKLSEMWRRSADVCQYLICYKSQKEIIKDYNFKVTFVKQIPTTMVSSGEINSAYVYRRIITSEVSKEAKLLSSTVHTTGECYTRVVVCDPLFEPSYRLVESGLERLETEVNRLSVEGRDSPRRTRSQAGQNDYSIDQAQF